MSEAEAAAPKKKKGGKKIILLLGAVLLLGGGGAGAALFAMNSGMIGGPAKPAEPERPHLVPREGVSEEEAARYYSPTGDRRPDPAKFQASYYALADQFTSNLRDGSGFIQVGIGVSTYYDERVIEAVKLHEMAVRSAVLTTLSDQDPLLLSAPGGKDKLQASLRTAVNDVLKKKEGFGGIDDVYFTTFVVQ